MTCLLRADCGESSAQCSQGIKSDREDPETARTDIAKSIVESCLEAVGIDESMCPEIYELENYTPPSANSNNHIVLNESTITLHEHFIDRRELERATNEFATMEALLNVFVRKRIDWACTIYLATEQKNKVLAMRKGKTDGFFKERKRVENIFNERMNLYLNSANFRTLSSALMKHSNTRGH